jgi:hypothetical protein
MFVASGYTYVCPIDADSHSELSKFADAVRYSIETFAKQQSFAGSPLLKYRYRHMGKCNVDVEHESGLTFGAGLRTYSYMERVDTVFSVFIPGLDHYRVNNRKGSAVVDLRLGILARKRHRLVVHCTNVFNRFVALRPAKPEAPRGIGLSYECIF